MTAISFPRSIAAMLIAFCALILGGGRAEAGIVYSCVSGGSVSNSCNGDTLHSDSFVIEGVTFGSFSNDFPGFDVIPIDIPSGSGLPGTIIGIEFRDRTFSNPCETNVPGVAGLISSSCRETYTVTDPIADNPLGAMILEWSARDTVVPPTGVSPLGESMQVTKGVDSQVPTLPVVPDLTFGCSGIGAVCSSPASFTESEYFGGPVTQLRIEDKVTGGFGYSPNTPPVSGQFGIADIKNEFVFVPEPSSIAVLGFALAGLGLIRFGMARRVAGRGVIR